MKKIILTVLVVIAFVFKANAQKKVKLEDNSNASNFYFKNGKVGVNNNNPESYFHITSGSNLHNVISDGNSVTFRAENDNSSYINKTDNGKLVFRMGANYGFAMVIDNNRNVGIATPSPEGNLQIGSGTENGMLFLGGGKGYSGIGSTRSDGGLALGCNIYSRYNNDDFKVARVSKSNSNGFSGIKLSRNGEIDFFGKYGSVTFDDVANSNENIKMRISQLGDIGIGTLNMSDSSGSYKLSVNGKVRASEVKVYTGWADFVFKKEYDLPTLEEVEKHIKAKGHLQDIPNAKEVKENGVFLGEMNSKLLQKIEELTLYTIQQEKRINSLESKNVKLEEEKEELKSISTRLSRLEKMLK